MALSSYSPLLLLSLCVCSFLAYSAFAQDFSILGYNQEDLASDDNLIDLFESWMLKSNKSYESIDEKLKRFEIFKDNLFYIDETNMKGKGYWLGLTDFTDLTNEEFRKMYLGSRIDLPRNAEEFIYKDGLEIPSSIDWRRRGAVTGVKNQGSCGSCWAFSSAAAIEGINKIVTGNLVDLSEQQILDCDSRSYGCNGGYMTTAFDYVAHSRGLNLERDYPYTGRKGNCQPRSGTVVTISGYGVVPRNNQQSFFQALANQPLSVTIESAGRDFQHYRGGIFAGQCGTRLDHAVTAVGYEPSYIIVKNSWGTNWGENGYIRMKRISSPAGLCGIYMQVSYPVKRR